MDAGVAFPLNNPPTDVHNGSIACAIRAPVKSPTRGNVLNPFGACTEGKGRALADQPGTQQRPHDLSQTGEAMNDSSHAPHDACSSQLYPSSYG